MELEPAGEEFQPVDDRRPKLLPPPPVQLVAIADLSLLANAGLEKELDRFYVDLLRLERDEAEQGVPELIYRAANFRLRLTVVERRPPREDFSLTGFVVPSLAELMQRLDESKIVYVRQRSIWAGTDSIILLDPAGNSIEVTETGTLI